MPHNSLTYRLYAWVLVFLFTGSLLGNALHIHVSDCDHFHEFGAADKKLKHGSSEDPTMLSQASTSNLLLVDCHWGDFTASNGVVPIIGVGFLIPVLVGQQCLSEYRQPDTSIPFSSHKLRGPPVA